MAKDHDLTKHTLNLYAGDYEKIRLLYPEVGAGLVIRRVIRQFLDKIESNTEEAQVNEMVKL